MIVFSRPPGWRRRAGLASPKRSIGFAQAGDVWTSSSDADAILWRRKATLWVAPSYESKD